MGRISSIIIITVAVAIITGVTGYTFFDSPIAGPPTLAGQRSQPMAKEEERPVETSPPEEEEFPDQIRRARIPLMGAVPS